LNKNGQSFLGMIKPATRISQPATRNRNRNPQPAARNSYLVTSNHFKIRYVLTLKANLVENLNDDKILSLIDGCKKQQRESQRMLYEHFYSFSMRICLRYSYVEEEAIEIMNDGFMKVFHNLDKFDQRLSFRGWLKRIMINTAIDYFRKNKKYQKNKSIDEYNNEGNDIAQFEDSVISKMSYNELIGMVQQLSPAYRTVFNLYVIDGYNHKEIAEKLNISEGSSKSNLSKARERLRQLLKFFHAEYEKSTR
jgi:RNA polymerase sigma factor (sigma-70 family)